MNPIDISLKTELNKWRNKQRCVKKLKKNKNKNKIGRMRMQNNGKINEFEMGKIDFE